MNDFRYDEIVKYIGIYKGLYKYMVVTLWYGREDKQQNHVAFDTLKEAVDYADSFEEYPASTKIVKLC